jgi:uncharacterized protein
MLTTWPVFTETMYLLGDAGGWNAQEALWIIHSREDLQLIELARTRIERVRSLMKKYADVPMSLADATLVAVAEKIDLRTVFTLDSDFDIYRIRGRRPFERVPSP